MKIAEKSKAVAGLTIGSVAAGYVQKFVPIENPMIKAAAPILVGFFLIGKKGMVADLGAGMIARGGSDLLGSFGIGGYDTPNPLNGILTPSQMVNATINGAPDNAVHSDNDVM